MILRVAICVITYRRPASLAGCLQSLAQLEFECAAEVSIIVIDNDAKGSARGVVEEARQHCAWPLTYEIEPERGISHARNRSVRVALAQGAEFVAYIDDDETADSRWLADLMQVQQRYGVEVVSGPVVPNYDPDIPDWVIRGRFFERPRHATGTRLSSTRSGNCLISRVLLSGSEEPFDAAFALTGGSDSHFFRLAHQRGATIIWADAAVVYERVPTSRATVWWLLQRAYRGGASYAASERKVRSRLPIRLFTGLGRLLLGALLLLPSFALGKAAVVQVLVRACVGAGLVSGTFGLVHREYLVVHGE